MLGAQLPSLTGCLNFEFHFLPVQIPANEFKSSCEPFPQVGASLPHTLPSSPSLSFSLTFEILGFFLKLVEGAAAMVWDGFALTLRGRLVGWMYLYISYQSVLASLPSRHYSSRFFSSSLPFPRLSRGDGPAPFPQAT